MALVIHLAEVQIPREIFTIPPIVFQLNNLFQFLPEIISFLLNKSFIHA